METTDNDKGFNDQMALEDAARKNQTTVDPGLTATGDLTMATVTPNYVPPATTTANMQAIRRTAGDHRHDARLSRRRYADFRATPYRVPGTDEDAAAPDAGPFPAVQQPATFIQGAALFVCTSTCNQTFADVGAVILVTKLLRSARQGVPILAEHEKRSFPDLDRCSHVDGSRHRPGGGAIGPGGDAELAVFLTHNGDRRLFVVELGGRIRIVDPTRGGVLPTAFLDIDDKVSSGGERGLFSMAFYPDRNGFFYLYYTDNTGAVAIERYRVSANPDVADPNSGQRMLTVPHPADNHNGGQLQIGPGDGYLYAALGDGGGQGDASCNAQTRSSLLGKMLRLDVRQNLNQAPYYGIPAGNPFIGAADQGNQVPDEIWALGLRNPWRFSFDRVTRDLYIGDVGQDQIEEIDVLRASTPGGANLGWKMMEGSRCNSTSGCPAGTPVCNATGLIGRWPSSTTTGATARSSAVTSTGAAGHGAGRALRVQRPVFGERAHPDRGVAGKLASAVGAEHQRRDQLVRGGCRGRGLLHAGQRIVPAGVRRRDPCGGARAAAGRLAGAGPGPDGRRRHPAAGDRPALRSWCWPGTCVSWPRCRAG